MKYLVAMMVAATLAGCSTEQEKTATFCTTVENSKIEPDTTGFRDVIAVVSGLETTIGYQNGELVPHSECTAAIIDTSGGETEYAFYEFGQPVERDGITSISFYTNSLGQTSSLATALRRSGQWQEQTVEGGQITKQEWLSQSPFDSVVTVKNYNGDDVFETVVTSGVITKTKRYNANSAEFDCTWSDNGVITSDAGCANEAAFDSAIVGVVVDSDFYLNEIETGTVTYDTDPQEYQTPINTYF